MARDDDMFNRAPSDLADSILSYFEPAQPQPQREQSSGPSVFQMLRDALTSSSPDVRPGVEWGPQGNPAARAGMLRDPNRGPSDMAAFAAGVDALANRAKPYVNSAIDKGNDSLNYLAQKLIDLAEGPVGETIDSGLMHASDGITQAAERASRPVGNAGGVAGGIDSLLQIVGKAADNFDSRSLSSSPEGEFGDGHQSDESVSELFKRGGRAISDFANGPVGDSVDSALNYVAQALRGGIDSVSGMDFSKGASWGPKGSPEAVSRSHAQQVEQTPQRSQQSSSPALGAVVGMNIADNQKRSMDQDVVRMLDALQRQSSPGTLSFAAKGDSVGSRGSYSKSAPGTSARADERYRNAINLDKDIRSPQGRVNSSDLLDLLKAKAEAEATAEQAKAPRGDGIMGMLAKNQMTAPQVLELVLREKGWSKDQIDELFGRKKR